MSPYTEWILHNIGLWLLVLLAVGVGIVAYLIRRDCRVRELKPWDWWRSEDRR